MSSTKLNTEIVKPIAIKNDWYCSPSSLVLILTCSSSEYLHVACVERRHPFSRPQCVVSHAFHSCSVYFIHTTWNTFYLCTFESRLIFDHHAKWCMRSLIVINVATISSEKTASLNLNILEDSCAPKTTWWSIFTCFRWASVCGSLLESRLLVLQALLWH